jgi:cyclomaltodextrinase
VTGQVPDWVRHAIWWQAYPLGATGAEREALPADARPVPRLRGLQDWLDHLLELGCNGLALGPVFASQTHGYDTVDHVAVDRRLGTEKDLLDLVEACHERGVRVLLDGVFNHVGRDFPRFRQVLEEGPDSPAASWFHIDATGQGPDGFAYRDFEGHSALVALDHGNPEVADHVVRAMTYWCDRGIDAWRLDAAYAVPPTFWRAVLSRVRERHPDLWVVGEVIHGDYPGYVADSGVDSVTQYELWKAVWSSLNDRNLFELAHALRRHGEMARRFLPQTFVGNHDVTRIASRLTDHRHLAIAVALLCILPGVPTLYYGDEWGLLGVKEDRAGGDDAVRPPLPAGTEPAGPKAAAVADLHRQLISLRRRHPWLVDATVEEPDSLTNDVLAVRLTSGERTLALVLGIGDAPADVVLPFPGGIVAVGSGSVEARDGRTVVHVPAHSVTVVGRDG